MIPSSLHLPCAQAEEFIEAVMGSGGVDGFNLLLKGLKDSETRGNIELGKHLQQAYQSLKAGKYAFFGACVAGYLLCW